MRYLQTILFVCIIISMTAVIGVPEIYADDQCYLAKKVAERAATAFKKDKREGLKLFIKAQTLCPDDATLNFNLGLAYFRYRELSNAEKHLNMAVEKGGSRAPWLNLLAWVMLERGGDAGKAAVYAKKAVKLNGQSPQIRDTYIRALTAAGHLYDALSQAKDAKKKWPKDDAITKRYEDSVDAYVTYYLEKTKAGKHDTALSGLKKATFDPAVENAYCWALLAADKPGAALREAAEGKKKFRGDAVLKNTFTEVADRYVQTCYRAFRAGKRQPSIKAMDQMKGNYPSHRAFETAYDEMLKVVCGEAATISVPEPMKIARKTGAGGRSGSLLSDIQGRGEEKGELSLIADVDKNIPAGRKKRPKAVAVIIGNKRYASRGHGIPDVEFAERDALYVKKYVMQLMGYSKDNIIDKINATQGDLAKIFGTSANPKGQLYDWMESARSDEVFIYYSGHGAPDKDGKGAFLMPVDADVNYIASNGFSMDTFYRNLEQLPAKRITVVIDACFSGNSAGGTLVAGISPAMLRSADPVRKIGKGVVFTSAGKDQVSHWYYEKGHSLFTYFFLKGLRGDADKDGNKRITTTEMRTYLCDSVPYRAQRMTGRKQTPVVAGDAEYEIARLK